MKPLNIIMQHNSREQIQKFIKQVGAYVSPIQAEWGASGEVKFGAASGISSHLWHK